MQLIAIRRTRPNAVSGRLGTLFMVVLMACGLYCTPAAAQDNFPLVPEAISTHQLKSYSDMLGLSKQQRLAVFDLHDAHIAKYNELQQREVRELFDKIIAIGMRFMANQFEIPSREEIRGIVSDYRSILSKANRLDGEFFASLTPLLSEQQVQLLPKVEGRREMHLYEELISEGVRELNRGASVDLWEITDDLELTPEEVERTKVILDQYEASRLRRMRDAVDMFEKIVGMVLDTIDELGLRNLTPERMMELGQDPAFIADVQNRFNELSKPIQAAAYDASQHNMSTFRQLVPLLSKKNAWELRDRYYRRAYRRVYDGPGDWRRRYREALHIAEATEEQLNGIRTQLAYYDRADAQLVDSIVDDLEKSRKFRTAARFGGEEPDPMDDKIADYRERRSSLHASAMSTLEGLLGPTLLAQLNDRLKEQDQEQRGRQGSEVIVRAEPGEVEVSMTFGSFERPDPEEAFRPYPMTASEMQLFEHFLGVKQQQAEVVSVVYDSYRERYERMRNLRDDNDAADDAQGAEVSDAPPVSEKIRQEQAVFDSLAGADAAFFDDVELIVGDDAARHVRWMRQFRERDRKTRLSRGLNPTWGDDEAYVDLAAILVQHTTADQLPAGVDTIMAEYHDRMVPLIDERAKAASDVYRRRLSLERIRQSPDAPASVAETMQERMQDAGNKVWSVNRRILQLNRDMVQRLLTVLDENTGWAVRWEYNKAAYPDIFDERSSALRYFDAALDMPDIDERQRQRISELLMKYRRDYFAASEEMVDLRQGRDFNFANFQMPSREDIDREMRLEQLRFARREAANRAKYQLQLVLREEQAARIPELKLLR